jgi:phosphoglycolate phosphatase-like HAD superfamily hydrolase
MLSFLSVEYGTQQVVFNEYYNGIIEDTSVDILTAKNMGAALAVGVLWGFRTEDELAAAGADRVISEPAELISEVLQ